jgi:hypothetical protein
MESPLPGTSGNIEFLALLRRGDSTAPLNEAASAEVVIADPVPMAALPSIIITE